MGEWQDISTAPKDGTPILAYGGAAGYNSDYGSWNPAPLRYPAPSKYVVIWREGESTERAIWRFCSYDSGYYGEWEEPTHWLPLPKPPKDAA